MPVQGVRQGEYIGYHGYGNGWQFPAIPVGVPDYIVVQTVTRRVEFPHACTATATQTLAYLTLMGVVPLPSCERCRVGEYLNRPVDDWFLHDVAGFRRTRYPPCRKHLHKVVTARGPAMPTRAAWGTTREQERKKKREKGKQTKKEASINGYSSTHSSTRTPCSVFRRCVHS